jgi:Family of unknown function (DUF5681)
MLGDQEERYLSIAPGISLGDLRIVAMTRNFEDRPYEVGYGKPPINSRFQKGKSGNEPGRPPGSKNHLTALSKILDEKVTFTENGKRRSMTKLELAMNVQLKNAANGDTRAFQTTLQVIALLGLKPEEQKPTVTFIIEE